MFADLIVMLEGSAMFTAGPPLVQASLGIEATPEQLGGARMHTSQSGVAHNLAGSEEEAFAMCRYFLSLLPARSGDALPEHRVHHRLPHHEAALRRRPRPREGLRGRGHPLQVQQPWMKEKRKNLKRLTGLDPAW